MRSSIASLSDVSQSLYNTREAVMRVLKSVLVAAGVLGLTCPAISQSDNPPQSSDGYRLVDPENLIILTLVVGLPAMGQTVQVGQLAHIVDQTAVENLIDATATWLDHFIRGDANIDGTIDISDAEVIIAGGWLGVPLPCQDAADANDDGTLDISDVITVLQHLFSGTAPPPAPFR